MKIKIVEKEDRTEVKPFPKLMSTGKTIIYFIDEWQGIVLKKQPDSSFKLGELNDLSRIIKPTFNINNSQYRDWDGEVVLSND